MFIKSIHIRFTFLTLVALMLAGSTGCQLFPDRPEWSKKLLGKEEEVVLPTRMMVMWTDTILHQPHQSGVRGFGARIYFYNDDNPDPVKVDGGLAVYAFDADDLRPKSPKPKRKFVFTADQLAQYMSHTSMGTSYSVWCPWDEVGGYNKQLSLIVRFEGRNGGVVISDATVKLLPGLNKPASVKALELKESMVAQTAGSDDTESSTRLAGYEKASTGSSTTKEPRRQTETIDLPPSFYRHLKGPHSRGPVQQVEDTPAFFGPAHLGAESPNSPPPPEAPKSDSADAEPADADSADAEPAEPKQDATTSTKSTSRPARYPRRTVGNAQLDALSEGTRQHSLPSGWIPQLPKTPRYGYPNSSPEGDTTR